MTPSRPPALAIWLLERADVDRALTGDLIEGFRARRSAAWFWRQACTALVISSGATILAHKWLALRAIATGWIIWAGSSLLLRAAGDQLHTLTPDLALTWGAAAVTAVQYAMWVVNGWVIGRLHRPHHAAMVLAYVAFALVMSLPAVCLVAVEVLGHPAYAPPSLPSLVLVVASLVTGGLLSASSRGCATRHGAETPLGRGPGLVPPSRL